MNSKILKKIVGAFGFKLVDKKSFKNQRLISKNSVLNIEFYLSKIFERLKIRNIIQVGANDGKRFDELSKFIDESISNCILIEPIPKYFEELKKNLKNKKNVKLENCAISKDNEISFLYSVKNNYLNKYDEHIKAISSFDIKHLLRHGVKKKHIEKIKVMSSNFRSLIKKYDLKDLDLLYIDAEGYDGKIVLDFFENSKFEPIIIFEYVHIDSILFEKVISEILKKNYIFFSSNENLICFKKNKHFL
jgi:FkbM family methyltransferase